MCGSRRHRASGWFASFVLAVVASGCGGGPNLPDVATVLDADTPDERIGDEVSGADASAAADASDDERSGDAGADEADTAGDTPMDGVAPVGELGCDGDSRWCSQHPPAEGHTIRSAWAVGRDDIWAVGDRCTLLHWNGRFWKRWRRPVIGGAVCTAGLRAVHGTGSKDIWAAGEVTLHWDGDTWSAVEDAPPGTNAVWAAGPREVWIAGTGLHRWDGSSWSVRTPPSSSGPFHGVWMASPNDVWVGGSTLWRWNGTDWTQQVMQDGQGPFRAISGTGPDDVWVAGSNRVHHWNGLTWGYTRTGFGAISCSTSLLATGRGTARSSGAGAMACGIPAGLPEGSFDTLERRGPEYMDLMSYQVRLSSRGWTRYGVAAPWGRSPTQIVAFDALGLAPASDSDFWVFGTSGVIRRVAGTNNTTGAQGPLLGGAGRLFARDPATIWTVAPSRDDHDPQPMSVVGDVPYFPDLPGVLRWTGETWAEVEGLPMTSPEGVWFGPGSEVWIVDLTHGIHRFDGTNWTAESEFGGYALGGTDADHLWVVGPGGRILRRSGGAWVPEVSTTTADLLDVWARNAEEVWAVGRGGNILVRTGGRWQTTISGTSDTLYRVRGLAAEVIWAAGGKAFGGADLDGGGTLLLWDGAHWGPAPAGPYAARTLASLWASAADDLWVVDVTGGLFQWDGTHWKEQPVPPSISPTPVSFNGQPLYTVRRDIWGTSRGSFLLTGAFGQISLRRP